jgi:hypothetical protein
MICNSPTSSSDHNQLVAMIAMNYSDQVKLDFDCFKGYIKKNFEQ